MRILAYSTKPTILKISKELSPYIYMDSAKDIESIEYAAFIRRYDLIYIHVSENEDIKKFYQLFKYLNKIDDFNFNLNICYEKETEHIKSLIKTIKTIYKNLSPTYIHQSQLNLSELISKNAQTLFYQAPETIKSLEIDVSNQIISIDLGEGVMTLNMSNKEQKKAFQLLLFFIRHYGEVINMSTILSGTAKEPELASFSPIEGAISNIREIFSSMFKFKTSVKSIKKVGYEFTLQTA